MIPFISIIIILPLAILMAFNLSMNFYVNSQTEKELKNTVQTMTSLVEAQEQSSTEDASATMKSVIADLSAGLTAAKLTTNSCKQQW